MLSGQREIKNSNRHRDTDLSQVTAVHVSLQRRPQPVHVALQPAVLAPRVLHLLRKEAEARGALHRDVLRGSKPLTRLQSRLTHAL